MTYEVSYTRKDLILYALSLGMGSTKDDINSDLRYLFEDHTRFSAIPTCLLTFTFWADQHPHAIDMNGIPPFPPPILANNQVIPTRFLRFEKSRTDSKLYISSFPVIHMWQSILWHGSGVPVPSAPIISGQRHNNQLRVKVDMGTISVQPKSIGCFVTTQTQLFLSNEKSPRLCTMQSTSLVMGIPADQVIPFDAGKTRLSSIPQSDFFSQHTKNRSTPVFRWCYQTNQAQALLYRIASGDSNHIHVDSSVSERMGTKRNDPILHGMFTIALAFRAIVKLLHTMFPVSNDNGKEYNQDVDFVFRKLEGKFTNPAFVGDCLCVQIWNDCSTSSTSTEQNKPETFSNSSYIETKAFAFLIVNHATGRTLVDNGLAEVAIVVENTKINTSRL